ncbi:MAG: hypothetical protein GKS03_15700 [Alphaproteobacteria bacterium]|nr:hypothetical protein [Alphaproteobacteria bacterium]
MKWTRIPIVLGLAVALSSAATAQTSILSVRTEDCRQLVSHVPSDDVAYVPGVDVRGRPVVPADLGGGYDIFAPEEINIDIQLDLAERLGLGGDDFASGASTLLSGEGVVGQVSVRGNDIYWNGNKLARDSHAALSAACGDAFTAAGIPLPLPKPDQATD